MLSTLASGYAETGDFKTAIEWIEKALEVNKQVAEQAADKSATDRQYKSLNQELESYRNQEPWREKKDPAVERAEAEAERAKNAAENKTSEAEENPSDQPADEDDPPFTD